MYTLKINILRGYYLIIIFRFLSLCGSLELGQAPPRIGEAGMESELKSALLELARASHTALIRCLPQLFDQLISLIVHPPTLPSQPLTVAALYLPLLNIIMDALPQLYHWDSKDKSVYTDKSDSITQKVALTIAGGASVEAAGAQCRVSLSSEATRQLFICALWMLKSLEKTALVQWCSELSSRRILSILQVLNIASAVFKYEGKKALKRLP